MVFEVDCGDTIPLYMLTDKHDNGVKACAVTGIHVYYGQEHNRCLPGW